MRESWASRSRRADALAAVKVEGNRLVARLGQLFVQNVEHFQERHVRRDVLARVAHKATALRRVLGHAAIDLLREAKPKSARPEDCICPGPSDPKKPYRAINNARRLVWQAAGLPLERGCDLHSLRHTFASLGGHVHNGRYAAFVAPLLGHGYQKRSITERYIHQNPEALRPAADAIAGAIARAMGLAGKSKVVEIRRTDQV